MADWTLDFMDQEDDGDLRYLDPSHLQFAMRGDVLRLTVDGDRSYLKVHAVRAFPLSNIHEYIGFIDAISGHEIGMLRNLKALDAQARQLVENALESRYFIPKISKIRSAKKEFGTVYWDVDTDRGKRQFVMRGIRDSIREIDPGRYLVNDVDGNRFEVVQLTTLDSQSQTYWDKLF